MNNPKNSTKNDNMSVNSTPKAGTKDTRKMAWGKDLAPSTTMKGAGTAENGTKTKWKAEELSTTLTET